MKISQTVLSAFCLFAALGQQQTAMANVLLNEVVGSTTGTDAEFIELYGTPGFSLAGHSIVIIERDAIADKDKVDAQFDFGATDALQGDGFLLLASPQAETSHSLTADISIGNNFIENGSYLIALVQNPGPSTLDTLTDVAALTIVDYMFVIDSAGDAPTDADAVTILGTGAVAADLQQIGPDGSFLPAGYFRTPDGGTQFELADFNIADNTPGLPNPDLTPPANLVTIMQVQGRGHESPLLGQVVSVQGIVTAVDSNKFFLQDPNGDDDIGTSDAIEVFNNPPGVAVGDAVVVTGTVTEYTPGGTGTRNLSTTQIGSVTRLTLQSTGNSLPAPVILGKAGRVPPSETFAVDDLITYDPVNHGVDFFESLEAMRVAVANPIAVAPTNRFGEIFVVSDRGESATGLSERGTLNISPDDFNPEKIQIDEDSGVFSFDLPLVNTGAELSDVIGVVSFNFGNFEVIPTSEFIELSPSTLKPVTVSRDDPFVKEEKKGKGKGSGGGGNGKGKGSNGDSPTRRALLDRSSTRGTARKTRQGNGKGKGKGKYDEYLVVATYNVLNLDPNDGDGDTDVALGRFASNAAVIVDNLDCPDVVGLQEIQDNNGSDGDGVTSASETLKLLVDEISKASNGACVYMALDNTFIGYDTNGGQPIGNIRTAFLYDASRVAYVPGSLNAVVDPADQQTNAANPFFDSRLPLAGKFKFLPTETYFEVVNNHWSSKGGSAPIMGTEQPFDKRQEDPSINGSLDERRDQSEAIRQYLLPKAAADEHFIVMGDLNEFEFISAVTNLEMDTGLVNLAHDIDENERYSFIFQGNSQVLDHILVSAALAERGAYQKYVHVNSEFAETAERASDHDPIVAWIPMVEGH